MKIYKSPKTKRDVVVNFELFGKVKIVVACAISLKYKRMCVLTLKSDFRPLTVEIYRKPVSTNGLTLSLSVSNNPKIP